MSFAAPLVAGFETPAPEPRRQALAGGGVAIEDAQVSFNPAAGPPSGRYDVFVAYHRPFGMKELQHGHVSLGRSLAKTSWALGAHTFGYSAYRENTCYAGCSLSLAEGLRAGLLLRYAEVEIQRYGRAGAVLVDFGIVAAVSERTAIGFVAKNVSGARIGRCREELPRSLQAGMAIKALPQMRLCADLFKDIRFPAAVRCGVEWRPLPVFTLRAGMGTSPSKLAAGMALQVNACRFDYGVDTHEVLGLSHQFALSFVWPRKGT